MKTSLSRSNAWAARQISPCSKLKLLSTRRKVKWQHEGNPSRSPGLAVTNWIGHYYASQLVFIGVFSAGLSNWLGAISKHLWRHCCHNLCPVHFRCLSRSPTSINPQSLDPGLNTRAQTTHNPKTDIQADCFAHEGENSGIFPIQKTGRLA